MSKILLHIEGLAVLVLSVYFYHSFQFSWLLFFVLLFVPDLAAIAYLKNVKVGSIIYNLFHTYIFPIGLLIIFFLTNHNIIFMISLVWISHIGMDRMCGYGLKYPTTFKDTHLNRVWMQKLLLNYFIKKWNYFKVRSV